VTFGAGDWDAVGRLTLRRVRALYAAWERTPPVAILAAGYLGYESKEAKGKKRLKVKGKEEIARFLADWKAAGGTVNGG